MTVASQGQRARAADYGLLALLALLWGSSYPLIKVALETIPPLTLMASRVVIAAALLFAVMGLKGERLPRSRSTWGRLFVQSILTASGAWALLAYGQQYVESAVASVLNSTSPLFVVVYSIIRVGVSSIGLRAILGALLGLAGVIILVGIPALGGSGTAIIAQLAVLGGAALYGCGALHSKRLAGVPSATIASCTLMCAAACLVPAALVLERPLQITPRVASLAAAGSLAVFSTGLALVIFFRLARRLGPLGVASQAYLRAGVGVLLGVVLLSETLSFATVAGLAAIICGVALINTRRRPVRGTG